MAKYILLLRTNLGRLAPVITDERGVGGKELKAIDIDELGIVEIGIHGSWLSNLPHSQ